MEKAHIQFPAGSAALDVECYLNFPQGLCLSKSQGAAFKACQQHSLEP